MLLLSTTRCRGHLSQVNTPVYFIVMEFIDGNPLRADIQRFGSDFLVDKAVEIAISVTSALSVAHQWEGAIVVHRDVKPENIMLDDNGRIVLLDFGFARLLERTGFAQTATRVGTPRYMSPEQFDRRADPKCDIWAVGVVLYEMLSGSAPFAGSDDGEIEHAVRYEQFSPSRITGTTSHPKSLASSGERSRRTLYSGIKTPPSFLKRLSPSGSRSVRGRPPIRRPFFLTGRPL